MPEYNLLIRRDEIDYDYIDKLSEDDKAFLNKFSEEWIGAKFHTDDKKNLLKGDKKKQAYGKNNARNRCQLSRARAQNMVADDYMYSGNYEISKDDYENDLIEAIDARQDDWCDDDN